MNNLKTNKIVLLFAFMFFSVKMEAQCLETIKKQNVFFILFENKDDKSTSYWCTDKLPFNFKLCVYDFYDINGKKFEYSFNYSEYPDADKMHNNIDKNMLFRINKSFLRKNKKIIITREFMEKMGKRVMLDLLYSDSTNKTILLINTADTKGSKILVREVTIDYTADE